MPLRDSADPGKAHSDRPAEWLFAAPGVLLVGLLALPLLALVARAAGKDFLSVALSESALAALRLSLITSLTSVMISMLIGTPLAYAMARRRYPGGRSRRSRDRSAGRRSPTRATRR